MQKNNMNGKEGFRRSVLSMWMFLLEAYSVNVSDAATLNQFCCH